MLNYRVASSIEGFQKKYIVKDNIIKVDSQGYESISEVVVSSLESFIQDFPPFVDYFLCTLDTPSGHLYACRSKDFKGASYTEISLLDLLMQTDPDLSMFDSMPLEEKIVYTEELICFFLHCSKKEVHYFLGKMIFLDAICLNSDRNLKNIGFLQDINGSTIFCPIFDNGSSLLSNLMLFPLSDRKIHAMTRSVRSKPFDTSFANQVKQFKDVGKLRINYRGFCSLLEAVETYKDSVVIFKPECYNRAIKVLMRQLKETEGILWERI